jgi:hypothetical protein
MAIAVHQHQRLPANQRFGQGIATPHIKLSALTEDVLNSQGIASDHKSAHVAQLHGEGVSMALAMPGLKLNWVTNPR